MGTSTGTPKRPTTSDARERLVATAYSLFCRHGIRAVGIDSIIERSGVAKMTFYRHFRSKDDLVVAILDRRERLWTREWLQAEVLARADAPADRMLAIFDVFDGWFHRRGFEGCLFVNALLEIDDKRHPVHRACREHLANIREFVEQLATAAGASDPDNLARQWHILMKGSIVSAGEGDIEAARRAKEVARLLLGASTSSPSSIASSAVGR
jgi:AcrR family transcriptional regulator